MQPLQRYFRQSHSRPGPPQRRSLRQPEIFIATTTTTTTQDLVCYRLKETTQRDFSFGGMENRAPSSNLFRHIHHPRTGGQWETEEQVELNGGCKEEEEKEERKKRWPNKKRRRWKGGDTYVVAEDILFGADFDRIGDEAKDGSDPEKHGKSAKEVLAKFHPFRRRFRRRQGIGAVALKDGLSLRCSQALQIIQRKKKKNKR